MNPVITKMEHLAIIVAKSSILIAVGFLDPPLHHDKFAAKEVGWFKTKRMVMCTCIR